jgi:hypothetical protein
MYNKFTITIIISAGIACAALFNKTNSTILHAKETSKSKIEAYYSNSTVCPVVGDGAQLPQSPSYDTITEDGVPLYIHCKSCNTGVYSERDDGLMLCTFCGKGE